MRWWKRIGLDLRVAASYLRVGAVMRAGKKVRKIIPRLPAAPGPTSGRLGQGERFFRLCLLGESTAASVGMPSHERGMVGQLAKHYHALTGKAVAWRVHGKAGATIGQYLEHELPRVTGSADLIVLSFGGNDVMQRTPPSVYLELLETLIDRARDRLGTQSDVLLVGAPPMAHFPSLPPVLQSWLGVRTQRLDVLSTWATGLRPGVYHVPLRGEVDPADFATDGFHPGERGYDRWCGQLIEGYLDAKSRRADSEDL